MALQQAERYGTPLANMLRVMAQENRDMRMSEAEKKAAGLPPKLTVPMILFFLPVLFVVILGPAAIKVMAHTVTRPRAAPISSPKIAGAARSGAGVGLRQVKAAGPFSSSRSAAPASAADS